MASRQADRLAAAHRLAQLRLGAITVTQLSAIWPLLDPEDLEGTFPGWLTAAVPIITAQRSASARVAAAFLSAHRALEVGFEEFAPILAEAPNLSAVATSMLVTGPVSIRSALGRGVQLAQAAEVAQARSAAAGMRHALDGGRETITQTTRADRRAAGWERIASGKACDFCSMLAGRGAVYGEASADFQAHDGCGCSAAPVYA